KDFLSKYFLTDGINFELVNKVDKKIFKIENPINPNEISNKNLIRINLNDYIKDIEGYILIKNKSPFVTKFDDLDFPNPLYRYDEKEGLVEVEEYSSLKIDDYILDKEINYFNIPLVENLIEDDFISGMKFTNDDLDEVIEKLD